MAELFNPITNPHASTPWRRQIAFNDAYIYMTVFNVVSTLSAMYGLAMFLQVTKGNLSHYHYTVSANVLIVVLFDQKACSSKTSLMEWCIIY